MRYLRMLSNSVVAGAVAASYVVLLVLHVNPGLRLDLATLVPLAASVGLFYGVHLSAIAYLMLVVRQLFGRELFSPAWISVSVLTWLCAFAAAAAAGVFWANVRTFSLVLERPATEALNRSVAVFVIAAAMLIGAGIAGRRWQRRGAAGLGVAAVLLASVAVPLALRSSVALPEPGPRPPFEPDSSAAAPTGPRLTVIALDAGSLEIIANAAAEGRLPNFGRVLDAGAVTHLATLHPTSPEAVWAAIATGKLPQKNGVRSGATYLHTSFPGAEPLQLLPDFCFANGLVRFGLLREQERTSASLRARMLWEILSASGITVGVVNFPLTYPTSALRGYAVSDAYVRTVLTASEIDEPRGLYPPELQAEASAVVQAIEDEPLVPAVLDGVAERHRGPARADRIYDRLHQTFSTRHSPRVAFVRYQSPDPIAHYFLRYAMPSRFGDVSDDDRRRYGSLLEAHYEIVDDAIGREIDRLGPEDLLVVVSGFGIEPLGIGKRVLEQLIGDPEISGSHEAAPDGFVMAYGAAVARGRPPRRASVVDVTPTLLYFLGLPIGRDMDGYARADLFLRSFTDEHPITFIPSYETR